MKWRKLEDGGGDEHFHSTADVLFHMIRWKDEGDRRGVNIPDK